MTNHAPTLETCKKLKEAGFPQDSLYYWITTPDHTLTPRLQDKNTAQHLTGSDWPKYAAPILTEILEQLKPYAKKGGWANGWKGIYANFFWDDIDNEWSVDIANCDEEFRNPLKAPGGQGDNPAEAAALLWLELKPDRP